MKKHLLPTFERVVEAYDLVAVRARGVGGAIDVGNLERDVMDSRAACGEEPVQEAAVGAVGLDDLDAPAAGELPLRAPETDTRATVMRAPAEPSDEQLDAVGHAMRAQRDVVELRALYSVDRHRLI